MNSYELVLMFEGQYTDYQIQQLVAERIFGMQGHQNQLYTVRHIRWVEPEVCRVQLHLRQPASPEREAPEQEAPREPGQAAPEQESSKEPEQEAPKEPGQASVHEPEHGHEALDELSLYEGPEEE